MTAGTKGQPPVTSTERRRSIRSHQAILAATTQLLAEVGYTALTIEGVATQAGWVRRPSIGGGRQKERWSSRR